MRINTAQIKGKQVIYNGICSPGTSLKQAKIYYPTSRYKYLGEGLNNGVKQHMFAKLDEKVVNIEQKQWAKVIKMVA